MREHTGPDMARIRALRPTVYCPSERVEVCLAREDRCALCGKEEAQ